MSKNNLNSQVKRISNNKTLKQPTTSKNRNITNTLPQQNIPNKPLTENEINIDSFKYIIIALIFIFIIITIGYYTSLSYRQRKTLNNLEKINEYIIVDSKLNSNKNRKKKLCDFYISAAYRPYLVKNQLFDYCSLEVLKYIIQSGVRCVYLDVFNHSLVNNAYPIVSSGIKQGEWKLTLNTLTFEDVCNTIAITAFSAGYVENFNDPFIICLNLNTNGNTSCLNKIKRVLYRAFKNNLLSNKYTYSSINIAEVQIRKLLGKVIIFSSEGYENSELEELINYSWNKDELRQISYTSLDPDVPEENAVKYNTDDLLQFNKNNLTMMMPQEFSFFTQNYNPEYAWEAGCQLVFMNYQKIDSGIDTYLTKFKNNSFYPKPNRMISSQSTQSYNIEQSKVLNQDENISDVPDLTCQP